MPPNLPKPNPNKHDILNTEVRGYIMTIDSHSTNKAFIPALRAVWNYISKHLSEFLVGRVGGKFIQAIENSSVIERGKKFHRIHIQADFVTVTRGFSWFDLNKLKTFINKNLKQIPGFVRANTRVFLKKAFNQQQFIDAYQKKDPLEEEPEEEFEVIPLSDED
jgi:hypothetical protein